MLYSDFQFSIKHTGAALSDVVPRECGAESQLEALVET